MSVPQQSLSLILCNLSATTSAPSPTSLPTLSSSKRDLHLPPRLRILLFEDSPRIAFLAEKVRKLLYEISRELLRGIMARDLVSRLDCLEVVNINVEVTRPLKLPTWRLHTGLL